MRNFLIIALVLFLCCFGGSIANPFASKDDSPTNPIVAFLGKFAAENTAVADADIQAVPASCRTATPNVFKIVVPTACTLNVAAGGTGMRNLILTNDGINSMTVESTVPGKDFTVSDDDFGKGEQVKVAIDERGGAVVLRCKGSVNQQCTATRGDGS